LAVQSRKAGPDVKRAVIAGFAVHVLTALGAALALLALLAAHRGQWAAMFGWLGVALIVDAVDGPLARALKVKDVLPRWSGDVLDLVIDFTTYVFVPGYAVAVGTLMPDGLAIVAGAVIVVTGALYFADGNMKTKDNHFQGFPAVWNVIAFYLLLMRPDPWINLAIFAALAVMTFLPIRFVHPLRVRRLRPLTLVMLAAWAVLALIAIVQGLAPAPAVSAALCLIAAYFLVVGFVPAGKTPT
jgi:phosphatidylcholine synthase